MLKRNTVFLKYLQYLTPKTDLRVHHLFFNIDRAEILLPGNTCDNIFRLTAGTLHDQGAFVLRTIRISDINGNSLPSNRENRIFMHHGCAHIGKLTKLAVGDRLNRLRVFHYAGICHHYPGDIRPVLIYVGAHSSRNDRSCHIRPSPGERLNAAVRHRSIEARDHSIFQVLQTLLQHFIGLFLVKISFFVKTYYFCRVNEPIPKIIRHYDTVQVFSPGRGVVAPRLPHEVILDQFKLFLQAKFQS